MDEKIKKIQFLKLLKEKRKKECRASLWEYLKETHTHIRAPQTKKNPNGAPLFQDDHTYLKEYATVVQDFLNGDLKQVDKNGKEQEVNILCVSMPPRSGKSITMNGALTWYIGNNPNAKIGCVSYSQTLMEKFSKDIMEKFEQEESGLLDKLNTKNIFPEINISKRNRSVKRWSVDGYSQTVNATTLSGQSTGYGYDVLYLDDLVKNSTEALSETALDRIWSLINGTFISRFEGKGKIIFVMTRWGDNDPIGKIKELENSEEGEIINGKVYYVNFEALINEEEVKQGKEPIMLCDSVLDYEQYLMKKSFIYNVIFYANYHQKLITADLILYNKVRQWEKLPDKPYKKVGVLDPSADGSDYTALTIGNYYKDIGEIYLTDIYYNNAKMTETQDLIVDFIIDSNVEELVIESNGAFIILKDNIEKKLKDRGCKCKIIKHNQSKNKNARILSGSSALQEKVLWMPDADIRCKNAFNHFKNFRSDLSQNMHDDLEDALTLMLEYYLVNSNKGTISGMANLRSRF